MKYLNRLSSKYQDCNFFEIEYTGVVVLQPLRWCCVEYVIHHERDVREEQQDIHVARTSNNRVISIAAHDFYCCLLPQCEALRTCRSGFPIAAVEESQENTEIVRRHQLHGRFRLLRKVNAGETQTQTQCASNHCSWSPSYKSVK